MGKEPQLHPFAVITGFAAKFETAIDFSRIWTVTSLQQAAKTPKAPPISTVPGIGASGASNKRQSFFDI